MDCNKNSEAILFSFSKKPATNCFWFGCFLLFCYSGRSLCLTILTNFHDVSKDGFKETRQKKNIKISDWNSTKNSAMDVTAQAGSVRGCDIVFILEDRKRLMLRNEYQNYIIWGLFSKLGKFYKSNLFRKDYHHGAFKGKQCLNKFLLKYQSYVWTAFVRCCLSPWQSC